jgi:hypothetical protein
VENDDEIELLDLAEQLLDRFAYILENGALQQRNSEHDS